ncbi:MAG: hypothetical protein OXU67_08590 [Chloroflexota bacterium]|nr:hypothetical protein [Chloroflexota bacterium]
MVAETMAAGPVPAEQHFATKAELAESNAKTQAALVEIERNLGEIKGSLGEIKGALPHLATKADIYRVTGGAVAVIIAAVTAIIRFLA